jgi:Beta-1,3-glucanase
MKRFLIAVLSLIALAGCGSSGSLILETPNARTNTVQLLDPTPDLALQGDPVRVASLRGYDAAGSLVFGPDEEVYDEDMSFSGLPLTTTRVEVNFNRGPGYTLFRHEAPVDFVSDADGLLTFREVPATAVGGKTTFTVKVVNNSAYSDDEVFVIVLGKDAAQTAFWYLNIHPNDQNQFVKFAGVDQFESVSQQLSTFPKEGPHSYSFQCPRENLISGRIYVSFGKKIQAIGLTNLNDPLSLQLPSASGFPDAQTVYEFMELSATFQPQDPNTYTLFANTSVVDFFSLGLGMTLNYHQNGQNLTETVGFVERARDLVLQEFQAATTPSEFQNFVKKDGTNTIIKVLAPVQGVAINPTGPISNFLNDPINQGWTTYASTVLNIPDNLPSRTYGYQWAGQLIAANILNMTCTLSVPGDNASLGEVSMLPKPTSRIVFFCDDDQAPAATPHNQTWRNAGTDGHKRLCSLLSAALNRGVFENYTDWDKSEKFYTRADGKYNHYAKIMHKFALDKKVYGFGYDDIYGQDPTLAEKLDDVNQVELTIPAFERI